MPLRRRVFAVVPAHSDVSAYLHQLPYSRDVKIVNIRAENKLAGESYFSANPCCFNMAGNTFPIINCGILR